MQHMQIIITIITRQCGCDAQDCIYNTKSNKKKIELGLQNHK